MYFDHDMALQGCNIQEVHVSLLPALDEDQIKATSRNDKFTIIGQCRLLH